jgi:hypothetical protein
MFIGALLLPLAGLDPRVKYFLVRFVQLFGIVASVQYDVKELAKKFGVSDRLVTKSLADLVGAGLLGHQNIKGLGRGRSKNEYRCTPSFVSLLSKHSVTVSSSQKEVIANLLERAAEKSLPARVSGGARSCAASFAALQDKISPTQRLADLRARKKNDCLSATNRLLLAVLLSRADRFGVASDFGSSELCKATGLSPERLRHRIGRLLDLGLIRAYVPGATSRFFYGKITSVYFLNLQHPEISDGSNVTLALACKLERALDSMHDVSSIYLEVRAFNQRPEQFRGTRSGRVLGFFKQQRLEFFSLLQHVLLKCVTYLLSKCWSGLTSMPPNQRIDIPELRELIRSHFRPPQASLADHADLYAIPVDELYERVFKSATFIKSILCSELEISLESMDFVFIPQPVDSANYGFTLLALPQSMGGRQGCEVIIEDFERRVSTKSFSCEAVIPIENQYLFGLRAKPHA